MSQALTLLNPEIRIIQTGLPYELAKTTFAVRIKESCYVKAVTYRYAYSADKDISARTIMGIPSEYFVPIMMVNDIKSSISYNGDITSFVIPDENVLSVYRMAFTT
jgi:hypothetical protein